MRLQFGKANVWLGNMDAISGQADEITPQLHKKFKDTLGLSEIQCLLNNMPDSVTFLFMRKGEEIIFNALDECSVSMGYKFKVVDLLEKPWETLIQLVVSRFRCNNNGYTYGLGAQWDDQRSVEIENRPEFRFDNVVSGYNGKARTFIVSQ